jgi:hypothetical protein
MTPFDINPEHDAGHTVDQDDLIAFHLRELPSSQERAVRRVLYTRPDLQAESIAIASTLRAFPKHEAALPVDAAALDRHWQSLRHSLPLHIPAPAAPFSLFRLQLQRWALPTAAAAILATTALVVAFRHNQSANPINIASTTAPTPSPSATASSSAFATSSNPYRAAASPISQQPLAMSSSPLTTTPTPQTTPATTAPVPTLGASSSNAGTASSETPASSSSQAAESTSTLPAKARPSARIHHEHTTDITLAALGNLTPDRSFTSADATTTAHYTQETTPSVGALASFHQQLRPWLGYRLTGSYSEPTFEYDYQAGAEGSEGNIVRQHAYEFSGTYVVQGPRHRRISTAAEVGAGLLALLPADPDLTALPVGRSLLPEGVFGVSAEFALTRHLAFHAGYRALLYKAPVAYPTYGTTVPSAPNNLTLSNQPVVGLTYRFHEANE